MSENAAPDSRATILIVDDSPTNLGVIVQHLEEHGFAVLVAQDGEEGLQRAEFIRPDLMLLDVMMPGTNGFEVCRRLKAGSATRDIPVIFMTALADTENKLAGFAAGGVDYVTKPLEMAEVLARITTHLALRAMQARLAEQHLTLQRACDDLRGMNSRLEEVQAQLVQSEKMARAVVASSFDGIVLLGVGGRIEGLNAAAERLFGWSQSEAIGRSFLEEFIAPGSRRVVSGRMAGRENDLARGAPPARSEVRGLRRTGQEFPAECNCARLDTSAGAGLCAFVRDLTEAQRLQVELQQALKLEAVGRLAAGVAHEINSPIQFVGDNTRFIGETLVTMSGLLQRYAEAARPEARDALDRLAEEANLDYLREQAPRAVERALRGVQRVASIVRAMMEFAHPDQVEMVAVDLNRSITATLEVARHEYKHVAELETDFGDLPPVTCHGGELNQVVLNVIINAAHAIADTVGPTRSKGTIRVTTRRDGNAVVLCISDTGTGIPEEIQDKVFDPFFTTKEVGRGTGQGLAIARAIVAKHHGSIGFESGIGRGTTFVIRVPIDGRARLESRVSAAQDRSTPVPASPS
jgi:PAS domain S-box-containing protein